MGTISITHHPMQVAIAATAVVVAVAVGSTVTLHDPASVQVSGSGSHPGATHHYRHFHTTSAAR